MKVKKFNEYFLIKEAEEDEDPFADLEEEEGGEEKSEEEIVQNSEPEEYVLSALMKLKRKIEKMFRSSNGNEVDVRDVPSVDVEKTSKSTSIGDSFEEMSLKLESIEINKRTKTHKSLRVKFTDDVNYYDLYIRVSIKEGIPKDKSEEVSVDSIKNAFVKFKKLSQEDFDLIGTITKNVKIKDIDEDFIISLNSELEEEFGDDEEEFKIET